jgi:predicted enzyme related to lactoylglutathione lyase
MAAPTFSFITLDCLDPGALARFWSTLLETRVGESIDDGRFVFLEGNDALPTICFQRVPEGKSVKNRMHLDFQVEDLDAATTRIQELGGSWSGAEHTLDTFTWRTVADPEGNEFDITVA